MNKAQPMKASKRMEMRGKTKVKRVTIMKISITLKGTKMRKKENTAMKTATQTKIKGIKTLKTMAWTT